MKACTSIGTCDACGNQECVHTRIVCQWGPERMPARICDECFNRARESGEMLRFQTRYIAPPGLTDPTTLRAQAGRRRKALKDAGCATYVIGRRQHAPGIVCLCCGLGSANARDVENRYCGFCHEWHSEWAAAANDQPQPCAQA